MRGERECMEPVDFQRGAGDGNHRHDGSVSADHLEPALPLQRAMSH